MSRQPHAALTPTVSQDNYRRLDSRVTSILKRNWPADEISQWVGLLSGEEQALACAILRRRHSCTNDPAGITTLFTFLCFCLYVYINQSLFYTQDQ
ncbi:hypothetical protein [Aeromonas sp. R6-2]|uniref:hypothetical protein n=1 Tax=unclassified Aeromonas TaxID=257493 RepID=UPI0034A1B70C